MINQVTDTLGHYLLEIVKAGGPMALWGIGIWLIMGIIRLVILGLVIYGVVRLIARTILKCYEIHKQTTAQRIHLLSQEVSSRLTTTLDNFSTESLVVVNELKTQLTELKELLKQKST